MRLPVCVDVPVSVAKELIVLVGVIVFTSTLALVLPLVMVCV